MNTEYNGWKNYETWNVALWIQNDESFYDFAKACKKSSNSFKSFYYDMVAMECLATPDGVKWDDSKIDHKAINKMIGEL